EALVWLLFPAVWLLEKTTQMLKSSDEIPTISRLEIEAMARIGANEGALVEREDRILRNLFHLERVQVQDIMTPRTVVLAFQKENTVAEIVDSHSTIPYSRLPIYTENMDDIDGFVLRNELYRAYATGGQDKTLEDLKRPIEAVPETKEMSTVFDEFINNQQHILLVIDEYGGTAGVLTMEDALETLLGIEITDESDMVADLRKMAQQRFENQQKVLENISTKPLPKSASTAPVAKVDDNTEAETDDAPVDEPEAQPESGD
ncbi:MAG: CBS domain-containing protein, partial [Chloroflexota bacterium]